jgi:hypothetical protein
MNNLELNTVVATLEKQRNNAMTSMALLEGKYAVALERISELEKGVVTLKETLAKQAEGTEVPSEPPKPQNVVALPQESAAKEIH